MRNVQPFLPHSMPANTWIEVKDGNDTGRNIFDRHYSRRDFSGKIKPLIYIGPGDKMVLIRTDASALFAWRRSVHRRDGMAGIECCIFRNEGSEKASTLICEADALADDRWPGEAHFTYVDPKKVKGNPPGNCFYRAGYRLHGVSQRRGLHLLVK